MAKYEVIREPHFRDGTLHPLGTILEIPSLEKGWDDYLRPVAEVKPPPAKPPEKPPEK